MRTELIVSTYNNPAALAACLGSVARQSTRPDLITIADDGSGPETAALIAASGHRHVWHPDTGFEKGAILNKAIATSTADLLIFIDGDVLIHPCFIARHIELGRPGRFCTGSLIRLDPDATRAALAAPEGVFDRRWLRENRAIDRFGTWLKTMPLPKPILNALEIASPVQKALCGANASAFRADLLKVNGYDETIKYGGEDKDLGVRLTNAGIRGRHLRYTAPLVHLDHPRGYANPDLIRRHKQIIRQRRADGTSWIASGITGSAP